MNKSVQEFSKKILGTFRSFKGGILLFLLLITPVIAVSFLGYFGASRNLKEREFLRRERIIDFTSGMLYQKLKDIVNLGLSLGSRFKIVEALERGDWDGAAQALEGVPEMFPFIDRVFLTDPGSCIRADLSNLGDAVGTCRTETDWFKGVSKEWKPYVSEIFSRRSLPHRNVIDIAIPLKRRSHPADVSGKSGDPKTQVLGILVLQTLADNFGKFAAKVRLDDSEELYIIDHRGHIIFNRRIPSQGDIINVSATSLAGMTAVAAKGAGIIQCPSYKKKGVVTFQSVEDFGWQVALEETPKKWLGEQNKILVFYMISSVLGILFALIILRLFDLQRKRTQELNESKEVLERERILLLRLAAIIEFSAEAIIGMDIQGKITSWNSGAQEVYGYTEAEALGKHASMLAPAGATDEMLSILEKVIRGEKVANFETTRRKKDGTLIQISLTMSPVFDRGVITGVSAVARDITQRKKAEDAVKSSEERLKIIFEYAPDAYYLFDLAGTFLDGNKAAEEICGYKKEELVGKSCLKIKLLAFSDMPKAAAALARSAMGLASTAEEYTLHRKDGSVVTAEVRLYPVKIEGKVQVLGCARDITRRKKMEEALREAHDELEIRVRERTAELAESRTYIEKILATITDYIYTVTVKEGVPVAVNRQPGCLAVTGYTAEEFKARPDLWESMVHEEDRPKVLAFSAAVLAGKNTKQIEYRIWHKDGGIRWVRNVPVLHYDPSGCLTSWDGIISDITEKKQAEMLLTESMEKLALANKAKGQFLTNMSHEVRTPLNAIIGFSCLLENTNLDPVQKKYVEMLHNGGEVLLSLITDVIDFSRIASGEVRLEKINFDLEPLIQGVLETYIKKLNKKDLRIFCTFDEKVPHGFRGDPARIRRILIQLLSNAIKFTEKGEVEVRVTLDREMEKKDPECVRVKIAVRDTGIGIPKDKHETIFEPFEQADISTTRKYGGAGLGLSISKTLANLMGGTIGVQSEPSKGSTFSLVLPLEVESAMEEIRIFPLKDNELEGKKILILDDEEMARNIFTRYCEEAKMVVSHSASSAQDALKWLSEQSLLPDIFLVDILLPDVDGYEVGEKIRGNEKYESMKLVAVSGDMREGVASKVRQSGFDAYLPKPASRENLIKVIKTVLGDKRKKILPVEIVTQYTEEELASKKLTVLVVEDNPASQELLSIILRGFSLSVEIASDGREAVEKVKKDPYDLILMDLQMPVMGGIEATRIIREQLHKTVPILALTAGVSEDDKGKCLAAGMNDYLMKPIEVPKFKDKVFHWIKAVPRGGPVSRKAESVMKWDKQRAIKELSIPEGLYRELVLGFIKQSATAIQDLEKAFQGRNFEDVARAAHFIKGAAGNLRIEEIHVTAKELEAVAKGDQDAGRIEEQMGSLKNAMEELKKNI